MPLGGTQATYYADSGSGTSPCHVGHNSHFSRFCLVSLPIYIRLTGLLADAQESITTLMTLCPFFLRPLVIAGEDWLEMPASNPWVSTAPCGWFALFAGNSANPVSPRPKEDSAKEILQRSPKTVTAERGGLREVRERIRRELELND